MIPRASFRLFIGTYTRAGSKGIYELHLDPATGGFTPPILAAETSNPTYLALSPDGTTLYAVSETEAMAVAFGVQPDSAPLIPVPGSRKPGGKAPSHLAVDTTGRILLVAHYHAGVVASLPILSDGAPGTPASVIQHHGSSIDPERQSSPHPHSVTVSPDNRFVFVCDLGLDKIFAYRLDSTSATISPAEPPFTSVTPGSGPRHFAFSPDGKLAFVISEMGGTLASFRYNPERGTLQKLDEKQTIASEDRGRNKSAAVRVHPNGHFVYASNRGPDTITVFAFDETTGHLSLVEIFETGGKSPRDFALSPDGKWLVAANQDSDSLTLFRVSPDTGRLTPTPATAEISMPVCVLFSG